ncbi:MAG: hypothetical protein M3317_06705 [Actinomycetota bacterium]|nr:hypothetical protein [Actinomycetota bacterium]
MPNFISDSSLSASIEVVYANGDGEYEDLFNKNLSEPGLARTTFSHVCRREFERLREEGEARGVRLRSTCPEQILSVKNYVLRRETAPQYSR